MVVVPRGTLDVGKFLAEGDRVLKAEPSVACAMRDALVLATLECRGRH